MRRVTSTRVTRIPSSRTCSGEPGSSRSRPLCVSRFSPSAWHSRLGPPVSSARRRVPARKTRALLAPSAPVPATGSSARSSTPPARPSFLAGNVHAIVPAVDRVNIRVPRRPKQHPIPRRRSAMRVRRWVGRLVVRAQIRLHLDDPPRHQPGARPANQQLAQQPWSHALRSRLKKRALKQLAGNANRSRVGVNCSFQLADSLTC